ncbi:AAA family ATPase [Deinococcus aquatilis]|uniref:ParA family protein n=1 Tax=Deinococcus aquatilis TaxID=519440 RepID=UPI0003777A4D
MGAELASVGARVLLIDLDPQANLTGWLGITGVQVPGMANLVAVEGADLPDSVDRMALTGLPLNGLH